jgi:hypothetical protein
MADDGTWVENISWDELQRVKNEVGYSMFWAVEVFPPEKEVVNVANMRHLFINFDGSIPEFAWRKHD